MSVNLQTTTTVPSDIWTIDDVGAYLRMTRRQVYEMTRSRGQARMTDPLPVLRINGAIRFRRADVEAWLARLAKGAGR